MKPVKDLMNVALGKTLADLVLKNATIFNSFTGQFITGDVAVKSGFIAGIGDYEGRETHDLTGKYLIPGFIDGHVHLESAMVSPGEFARTVVPAGTTTVVADPHEIANVAGVDGIRYILAATEHLPLDVYIMLPSCVPATTLETTGAKLTAAELAGLLHHPRVLGLGELMDYPGVLRQDPEVLAKLNLAEGKPVDGHAPGLTGRELAAYIAAGVMSDHECISEEEARERLALGMHLMLREGSAAKNLRDLLPVVNGYTSRRCLFVTDDRHPEDLINLGHINHMIRMAVEAGVDVATVLQMATVNAAAYFRLPDRGAIAPGYRADILVFDDMLAFRPAMVFKDGKRVAEGGKPLFAARPGDATRVRNTVNLRPLSREKLRIPATSAKARVIGVLPGQIVTRQRIMDVPIVDGAFVPDVGQDILKLAVLERYHHTGNVGVALVHGLGLKKGAIASTVAHDAHNVIIAGTGDGEIIVAAAHLQTIGGGIVIVADGRVLGELALPLAGLMAEEDVYTVQAKLERLRAIAWELGVNPGCDPFMTLAFLSLPVIPELKLTDMGLVDVSAFSLVPVAVE